MKELKAEVIKLKWLLEEKEKLLVSKQPVVAYISAYCSCYIPRGKTSLIDEVIEEGEWETDDEEEVDVEGIEGYKSESSDDDDEIQDEVLGSENDD
ncbi:hypothetical protein RHMOL_Rhmol02G0137300 [Rhododendron molle]|uniref:Uncharacterized protein n=1 Tax=Rhododendron molle TaxID=49168 RepID=A0ACC0PQ72_RHOML|nr:hypothetical protein RHMOL_Rhmol02G0137300 [Rhododendron molle]